MEYRQKILIILFIVLFVLAGFIFFFFQVDQSDESSIEDILAPPAAADYYEDSSSLKVEKGTVTLVRENGETEVVSGETKVGMGDSIQVSADGEATIYWFDDSISRLQGETQITIDQADYNPENFNETDISFEVISGGVWSKVQNLVDNDSEFLSYTHNIVAGVRGSTINHVVTDETVEIESIHHAATVGIKSDDGVKNPTTIVNGYSVSVTRSDNNIEVVRMPEDKLKSDFYKQRNDQDKKDSTELRNRRLKELKDGIGSLPGEMGFDTREEKIQDYLNSIEDPVQRAEAQIWMAQLQVRECFLLTMNGQESGNLAQSFANAMQSILDSPLSDEQKEKLLNELKTSMVAMDRMIYELPNSENIYKLKEMLRMVQIELEEDTDKKARLWDNFLEMKLYELYDLAGIKGLDALQLEKIIEDSHWDSETFKGLLEKYPEFAPLTELIFERFSATEIDSELLQLLREILHLVPLAPARSPVPTPVHTPPTPEIIEEAPYHQGESNV